MKERCRRETWFQMQTLLSTEFEPSSCQVRPPKRLGSNIGYRFAKVQRAEVAVTKDASEDCRIVDPDSLPAQFPTHRHQGRFWESLGRAVGTFGFLEEVLGKAIFALSATKPYYPAEMDAAYEKWSRGLERALTDPLGNLIGEYEKAICEHPDATADDLDYLICRLREASRIRNVLCHGSWRAPELSRSVRSVVCRQEGERVRCCS